MEVNIGGGGNELSMSIVDAGPLGGDVRGTSTERSRGKRANGIMCEEKK